SIQYYFTTSMHTRFWAFLLLLSVSIAVWPKTTLAVYVDPVTHEPIMTNGCVLTPDPAQKNAHTVYTLNISLTQDIDRAYYEWWGRYARCDELQFHAEHNTPWARVNSWLSKTQIQRYKDHVYTGGLFKTHAQGTFSDAKIWRIINGKRQRVYDWPTQMAWGFL